ncbi:MAG TPA: hypothetical protein ENF28_06310 [Proteobacteria bacterium]|nr:hypothetical protein [Pseudomonadota bacterium]
MEKMRELREHGMTFIDDQPRELFGIRYAVINPPDQLCGVLTEIVDGEFDPGNKESGGSR